MWFGLFVWWFWFCFCFGVVFFVLLWFGLGLFCGFLSKYSALKNPFSNTVSVYHIQYYMKFESHFEKLIDFREIFLIYWNFDI